MTFNVRGFRSPTKQQAVIQMARDMHVDVLFVQETNFRTRWDVVAFRYMWQVDAFFSLTHAASRGVGVIFMNNRLRRGAHCRFDTDGRVIALDLSLDGKRTRILNVYAPVTRTLANEFYRGVRSFMLEPLQYILLGDFNCVLDTSRDIRGPGQGGCNYQARELGNIVADWQLIDAWVTLHGDAFAATRTSGLHGSRLDRVCYK